MTRALELNIAKLCFEENDQINITEYTQICMLTEEVALLKVLQSKGFVFDVCTGLSLGEYAAVVASGAMSMEDAFKVVRKRGIYMLFPCKMYEIATYKVILGRIKWLVLRNLYAPAEKTPRHSS